MSTRLFAAGVLATTLVAVNTGAFAGTTPEKKAGASCCAMKASAHKPAAKTAAKTVKTAAKMDCACCKHEAKAAAAKKTVKSSAKTPAKKS